MNENIKVRKATLHNLPVLQQLMQEIAKAERPFDETLKDGFVEYYNLEQIITDVQCLLVVAEINNEIIASGFAQIRDDNAYHKHSRYAYLGFMYVHPLHRGKGINQQIVQYLQQFALLRGITELRLEVYPGNTPAVKAYEKAGFAPHILQMRMQLQ